MTPQSGIRAQVEQACQAFQARFGRKPRFVAVAPGRVNLIGEHTDYNDGFVLPIAIERQTVVVGDRAPGKTVRAASTASSDDATFEAVAGLAPGEPQWANYVRGVFAGFLAAGHDPGGADLYIDSTVPLGGGLSSSAAIEVATATFIEAMLGIQLDPLVKTKLCQRAEHEFAGMPCGIMDQFTSVMARAGHAIRLDCRTCEACWVPIDDPQISVVIINSRVKHELTGSEYPDRRRQCEAAARTLGVPSLRDVSMAQLINATTQLDPVTFRRARHVVGEIDRTQRAATCLEQRDWKAMGMLMAESHRSLRDDFEVSCAELDLLVDLAEKIGIEGGVFGSRMTGGGFGGCTVSLVRTDAAAEVITHISEVYGEATGIEPDGFVTRPAAGARILGI